MQTGIELPQIVILSSDEHLNSHVDSRDRNERGREDLEAALVEAHVKTGQLERVHNRRAQLFQNFIRQSTHRLSFNFMSYLVYSHFRFYELLVYLLVGSVFRTTHRSATSLFDMSRVPFLNEPT